MVVNVHEREYQAAAADAAALVATLSSKDDRLWPRENWPRLRLDPGLMEGATGGHRPVRYHVESVDPRQVVFRFDSPKGFDGWHSFMVVETSSQSVVLRHEIRMTTRGWARLTWPLFFRPMHDALLEEALDKAGRELGVPPARPYKRTAWVRLLRAAALASRRTRAPSGH